MTIEATGAKAVAGCIAGAFVTVLAVALAGCGSISDQSAAAALVSPGKYSLYTCQDIEQRTRAVRSRLVELQQLMARAEQGAGGQLVNALAYRTEYLQMNGEMDELAKTSAEKNCVDQSKWSSGRAVF